MNREISDFLKMNDVEYKEDLSLPKISPIKIGGTVDFVAYPDSESKLIKLIRFLNNNKIKYKLLGRMSNVLPPDDKYSGVLIRTDRLNIFEENCGCVSIGAGVSIPTASRRLCDAGLSGFEGLSGIPGSIGGAVFGNAGAFGREICELVDLVIAYDVSREEIVVLHKDECRFGYRDSVFKKSNMIILFAKFRLTKSDSHLIDSEMKRISEARRKSQPTDKPSLGSTFKRPSEDVFAAKLIDDCGLKGLSVGGATVSEKHAGFIINSGGATARDYIELSDIIVNCVFERYKIRLEREIEIM